MSNTNIELMDKIISNQKQNLIDLSKSIQQNPELGNNEYFASQVLSDYLEEQGFTVQRGVGDIETAFIATYERGHGGYHVAYCAEYDALPEIGHACGHHLIGVASVTAGVALAKTLDELSTLPYKVSVIGTPDEEGKGGKIDLINLGAFQGVDVAMMFHPGYSTIIDVESLAVQELEFVFHGQNAHAASEPWLGRNALDGVIQTFNGINALRQHVKPDVRIHGIITDGGKAANIIPDRAVAQFAVRSIDNDYLSEVIDKVVQCANGAALSTGTEVEINKVGHTYLAMMSNKALGKVFANSLDEAGYVDISKHQEGMGSIDMGNVSQVVPAIHPVLSLTDQLIPGHTREFADMCNTPFGYETMLVAGKSMAITGLKVIEDKDLQIQIREEFEQNK